MPRLTLRQALLLYGLLNAVLYSGLMPLWEGFDEPFHFGYVQRLANGDGWPDARTSHLSAEVGASLLLAPGSATVHHNLPEVPTYSAHFASPLAAREVTRTQLRDIPATFRWQPSHFLNYEAHHSPLAYLLLAGPERLLSGVPLPDRVFILRLLCSIAGTMLLFLAAERLFAELALPRHHASAAMFCVLSCQMTWATLSHVANDWLAVPVAIWVLVALMRYRRHPGLRTAAWVGSLLTIGLLTKAYFVALVPIVLVMCLAARRWRDAGLVSGLVLTVAGPWYVRTWLHYGGITGMAESHVGVEAMLGAAARLDWLNAAVTSIRAALWTGNNSFTAFSVSTVAAIEVAWFIALVLWARQTHRRAEWITLLYGAAFLAALVYSTLASFVHTHGEANGPSPWYAQVLLAPMLGLAFLGASRGERAGRGVAVALVTLFSYVLISTYLAKLIPLYGGYEGRTSLAALASLYTTRLPALVENLDLIALAPAWILLGLVMITSGFAIGTTVVLVRLLLPRREPAARAQLGLTASARIS